MQSGVHYTALPSGKVIFPVAKTYMMAIAIKANTMHVQNTMFIPSNTGLLATSSFSLCPNLSVYRARVVRPRMLKTTMISSRTLVMAIIICLDVQAFFSADVRFACDVSSVTLAVEGAAARADGVAGTEGATTAGEEVDIFCVVRMRMRKPVITP